MMDGHKKKKDDAKSDNLFAISQYIKKGKRKKQKEKSYKKRLFEIR